MSNCKLKILYLIRDGYPSFRQDVAALWGNYLPALGIGSDLVTTSSTPNAASALWGGGRTNLYQPCSNALIAKFGLYLHEMKALLKTIGKHYDAIQVRDRHFSCILGLIIARLKGIPFFYWMSFPTADSLARVAAGLQWRREPIRKLYLLLCAHGGRLIAKCLILRFSDHLFVQSNQMAEELAAQGVSRSRMTAVPMCIDPSRFPEALPYQNFGGPTVGYLGECGRVRQTQFLLEAMAFVRQRVPTVRFLLVGDAVEEADRAWLRELVSSPEYAGWVEFTGWVASDVIKKYFQQVDLALSLMPPDPLLDSATPTKLVEYLAMGRAVVANEHPDQQYVLKHSAGGIVTPYNSRAYSEAIITLLNDRVRCERMAISGRSYILANRNYVVMAAELAAKYTTLMGAGDDTHSSR